MPRLTELSRYLTREMITVLVVAVSVFAGLTAWHVVERDSLAREFIEKQKKEVMHDKREQVQTTLATVYQNLRAISLLPSVRQISGGNRVEAANEDVVESGRFSAEGNATVQALYNNLAGQVNVSEIYAVLDGLDADKGEIPFFMFDTVKFGRQGADVDAAGDKRKSDTPEESEEAEYAYFPRQTAALRQHFPRFDFDKLADIPAAASPFMRTCDNAQYPSIAHGDEKNTFGFLYSVPFYNDEGSFRGVISAIIRSNALEALLVGAPVIPVTEKDKAAQASAGWEMPEPSNFMLASNGHQIEVFDRRNTGLPGFVKAGTPDRNVFRFPLAIHSDAPWELSYYLPESAIEDALASHDHLFLVLLGVILAALLAASTALVALTRIRLQLGGEIGAVSTVVEAVSNGALEADIPANVADTSVLGSMRRMLAKLQAIDQAAAANAAEQAAMNQEISQLVGAAVDGDFSQRITLDGKSEYFRILGEGLNRLMATNEHSLEAFACVLTALARGDLRQTMQGEFSGSFGRLKDDSNSMIETLKGLVTNIKNSADAIGVAAREIAEGNLDLSHRSEQQAANLQATAASIEHLTATVKQNSSHAREANDLAVATSAVAVRGGELVSGVVTTMVSIAESSRRVEDIIAVIDGIAFQTNILALNAAVEAARAGEQGRGFSVVAAEVRALAQRSSRAAGEIKLLITNSVGKANAGAALVKEAGSTMDAIVTSVQHLTRMLGDIALASGEQSQGIEQINRSVGLIDDSTQQNAARVEQAAAAARLLSEQAQGLLGAVSVFQWSDYPGDRRQASSPGHRLRQGKGVP